MALCVYMKVRIIHRNIKLSNLLVSGTIENIKIKVINFGDFLDIKETIDLIINY